MNLDDIDTAADAEPIKVVEFPRLDESALQGTAGRIIRAVMDDTEAHEAAVLAQLLARFGATIGAGPHVLADNRQHPARLYPLVVGHTSDGAKGTSAGVVNALFGEAERHGTHWALPRISGLSSGEGLIECVRDEHGDPGSKNFDEGVADKRLLVEDSEFTGTLAVMERQGSTLPRIIREAWDGDILRTTTRNPLVATGAHIVMCAHVTPGELRLKLSEAQLLGGTMNRYLPIASRRTKLKPDGGNIADDTLREMGKLLAERVEHGRGLWTTDGGRVQRTGDARKLWHSAYGDLRKARLDGPVAKMLARAVPQVLRLSLVYALLDGSDVIEMDHLAAALALWDYAEATAQWMFATVDSTDTDDLLRFIATAGTAGRTRTEIRSKHFADNKSAAEVTLMLTPLLRDGHIRQEVDKSGRGRPVTRYFRR